MFVLETDVVLPVVLHLGTHKLEHLLSTTDLKFRPLMLVEWTRTYLLTHLIVPVSRKHLNVVIIKGIKLIVPRTVLMEYDEA